MKLLPGYRLCEVRFEEDLVEQMNRSTLPANWRADPVPRALNYLLNPAHPDFARIQIGASRAVQLDPRLIR